MSDAAITNVCTSAVTIVLSVIGFCTLWVKLRYGVNKAEHIEQKVEHNTALTAEAKDAASSHSAECDERIIKLAEAMQRSEARIASNDGRITALEAGFMALKTSVDATTKNIDSTRHELRGHLQTLTNKLDLMALQQAKKDD